MIIILFVPICHKILMHALIDAISRPSPALIKSIIGGILCQYSVSI